MLDEIAGSNAACKDLAASVASNPNILSPVAQSKDYSFQLTFHKRDWEVGMKPEDRTKAILFGHTLDFVYQTPNFARNTIQGLNVDQHKSQYK